MDSEKLKKEIIRRTRQFHSRRYIHERITSTKHVVVVERGTLPRTATKGNVRRQAVEDQYKELLDDIYGTKFLWTPWVPLLPSSSHVQDGTHNLLGVVCHSDLDCFPHLDHLN